jgi:hypothetical protein
VRDRGDIGRLFFRDGDGFGMRHVTLHFRRRLVFAQPLIDDLAQEVVFGPGPSPASSNRGIPLPDSPIRLTLRSIEIAKASWGIAFPRAIDVRAGPFSPI